MARQVPIDPEKDRPRGTSEFGEDVIGSGDKPAAPVRDVPLNDPTPASPDNPPGDVPFDEGQFDRSAQRAQGATEAEIGARSLFESNVDIIPSIYAKDEGAVKPSPDAAANQAYAEALIFNDPRSYEDRKARNESGLVQDEALLALMDEQLRQDKSITGVLRPEHFLSLTPEEQQETLARELFRVNQRKMSPRTFALITMLTAGRGRTTMPEFEQAYRDTDLIDLSRRAAAMSKQARATAERDVNQFVATQGFKGIVDAVTDVTLQDMTPIFPLLSRWGIINALGKEAGVEMRGWGGFWIGSGRAALREGLVDMTPEEFVDAERAMIQLLTEWRTDPVMSKLITKYAVLETLEAVFTDDVFDGASALNKWDVWAGNAETLLEGLFSVVILAKAGTNVVQAITKTKQVAVRNAASVSDPAVGGQLDELLQDDKLALEFVAGTDETVPAMLPRPAMMINDVDELPQSTKDTVLKSERVRSEILESSDNITGSQLSAADRTNAINREIKDLDLNDGAHVQGKMNTLSMKENGTGFNMRVVVGESAEGGYTSIDDAMDAVKDIDPHLETVTISRVNGKGVLEPVFESAEDFARALVKGEVDASTAGRIGGADGAADETFYLVYDRERFWHTIDKEAFTAETFQSGGIVPRALLSPNAKFGDEIYGNFLRAYMGEQVLLKNFDIMFEPFYRLGKEDKKFVASAFEWMEDFGKNNGRAPDINEIRTYYDGITEAQLNGMVALRTGMDTMHELFNRRLFRDWQALGFKTARPADNTHATFHGKVLERGDAGGGQVLDPETGKMVTLSARELDDLHNAGGRVMELDMPITAANETRHQATRVLLREGTYEVGELSTRPLVYHPGYSMRFYDDPYFIVKETSGIKLNGSTRSSANSVSSEAIRTAGTQAEAESFARRAAKRDQAKGVEDTEWKVVRANDLDQTESTLFQKQAIHREGRLFWDQRNFDRLPDVNGNRATLEDPVRSLERGIGQAARQLTHEDLLKSIKNAWLNDYGHLLGGQPDLVRRFDLKELSDRLKKLRRNTPDGVETKQIQQAKELIDYMRLIEGTESAVIPALREAALNVAVSVNRWTDPSKASGKVLKVGTLGVSTLVRGKRIEQLAMTMDPFRAMRSVAFNVFMVFRPVRQALLQSSQIAYLAALDPLYAASPRLFMDAYGLRRGLAQLRKSGYDDGMSVKAFAKKMGISEKEYRVLLREFDRSGVLDLVDVHSFSGGAGRFRKTALPVNDSPLGTVGYKARQTGRAVRDWMQNVGFNFGERNNLTFTYNLALRRTMKRNKYDSLLEMTRKDWDDLKVEASNLALGMVRPNNFGYQTGAIGVATQFLSFSHKAMLGLLGANPAIKGTDALRIALGTYLLYGANMYGARELSESLLKDIGMSDQNVPGTSFSLVDLISGGIIDTVFNQLGDMSTKDWKDVDLGFLAPGVDFPRMWDMQLRNIMEQPTKVAFGPFGNIASNVLQTFDIIDAIHNGQPDLDPADKFVRSAFVLGMAPLPFFNDTVKAYYGYKMGIWYSAAHEPLPLRTTMNGLIARGAFGARTKEELAYYGTQRAFWEDKNDYNNAVQGTKKVIQQMVSLFYNGTMTREQLMNNLGGLINLYEDMPEGTRIQFLMDVMEGTKIQNDLVTDSIYHQIVTEALANQRFSSFQEIEDLVDRFVDIAPEKRAQLKQMLRDAHASRIQVDKQALEELENGN